MKIIEGKQKEYAEYVAKNSLDGYSKGVVDYGERWTDLMEKRIPDGATESRVLGIIVKHAKEDSHTADSEGITGFMYGCAVAALAHFWIHGEQLRRWHNLDTQIGTEGEKANKKGTVLNPALLNVGPRKRA